MVGFGIGAIHLLRDSGSTMNNGWGSIEAPVGDFSPVNLQ